jgi:hypothetical protein
MTFPYQALHTKVLDLLTEGPKTRAEIAQYLRLGSGRVTILLGYMAKTSQIETVANVKNARGYAMNLWSLKKDTPAAPKYPSMPKQETPKNQARQRNP